MTKLVGKKREYKGLPRGRCKKNSEHKIYENENLVYNPVGIDHLQECLKKT